MAHRNLRRFCARVFLVAATCSASVVVSGGESFAQQGDKGDIEKARKLFAEAQKALEKNRSAEAAEKLNTVLSIKETAGVRFHLAVAYEQLGRLKDALDNYEKAKTLAEANKVEDVRGMVGPKIEALSARIPKLTVKLLPPNTEATVRIDDQPVDAAALTELKLDPGKHQVVVQFKGRPAITRTVELAESRSTEIEVNANEGAPKASASPVETATTPDEPEPTAKASSSKVPTMAWVAFGAGAAFAIGGFLSYAHAGSVADESKDACSRSLSCDPARASTVHRWDSIALTMWIGTGLAVGTGVVLILTGNKSSDKASSALVVNPMNVAYRTTF